MTLKTSLRGCLRIFVRDRITPVLKNEQSRALLLTLFLPKTQWLLSSDGGLSRRTLKVFYGLRVTLVPTQRVLRIYIYMGFNWFMLLTLIT